MVATFVRLEPVSNAKPSSATVPRTIGSSRTMRFTSVTTSLVRCKEAASGNWMDTAK